MPIYDIAGLKVKIDNIGGRTERQALPYLSADQSENQNIDIAINVSQDRIIKSHEEHPELGLDDWEYMLTGNDFYSAVVKYGGILLHASCIVVDGIAYAFSADSGVGKSTHTALWLKRFGDRAYMLNDDKPCIRIIDNKVYACGTPWSGTNDYSRPEIVPLGAICFIERSEENRIYPADTKTAVFNIFSQTIRRLGANAMERLLDTIEIIFSKVALYQLECNISNEAVEIAYNTIKEN